MPSTIFTPTETHDIVCKHSQRGFMNVEETGYTDPKLGDRLVVHPGFSDGGDEGWFISTYITSREFVTPKVFFHKRDEITQHVIDVIAKDERMVLVEVETPAPGDTAMPRTRDDVRDQFFTEDENGVLAAAKALVTAITLGDFSNARADLETLGQGHVDLENTMDELGHAERKLEVEITGCDGVAPTDEEPQD